MPRAYSYIRFSHPEQAKGRSQARQLEGCEKYCAAHGLDLAREVDYTFLDQGRSAYKAEHLGENGQLARFLRLVDDGTIAPGSYLIIESLDRLSREHVKLALPRFMDLLNRGINIVTLTDERVYSSDFTEADLILSIFVMARAHEESSTKAKRLGDAWKVKQDKARNENKPIGKAVPLWLTYTPEAYLIHEDRASIVRRVFQMAIDGHGKISIAKALNADGIPSFKGKTWATSSIQKLLTNRAVIGEYQPYTGQSPKREPRGEPISGYFPHVVDESTFYEAQAAISGRRLARTTKQSHRFNVWQGIAKCVHCNCAMHLVNKGKPPKGYTYLHCFNARKGLCKAKAVRLERTEVAFKEILAKVESLSLVQDSFSKITKQLAELDGRLNDLQVKLKDYQAALRTRYTKTLDDLAFECEQSISELEKKKNVLQEALGSEKITDKKQFFSMLNLDGHDARYRANALLKRLKIQVYFDLNVKDSSGKEIGNAYCVRQDSDELLIVGDRNDGNILVVPQTTDQIEKWKTQDFDSTEWSKTYLDVLHRINASFGAEPIPYNISKKLKVPPE